MAGRRKRKGSVALRKDTGWWRRLKRRAQAAAFCMLLGAAGCSHLPEPPERTRQIGLVCEQWNDARELWPEQGEPGSPLGSPKYIQEASAFVFAGIPRVVTYQHPVTVLENEGFVIGYCEYKKNPVWVGYRVDAIEGTLTPPRPSRFTTDMRTRSRVSHDDYTGSGYDRGHMAPNYAIASRFGREAQLQTFQMSNIAPQSPRLNRQTWRLLETRIANEYSRRYGSVWVVIGPIFDHPPERLPSGVAIPVAFYKVIVAMDEGVPKAVAMIVPQDVDGNEPKEQFLTSIREIELRTGFNFFHELDDDFEAVWEAGVAQGLW